MKLKNNLSNQELHQMIQQQNAIIQKQMDIIYRYNNQYMNQNQNKQNSSINFKKLSSNQSRNALKIRIQKTNLNKYNQSYQEGMRNNKAYNEVI